MDVYIRAFLFLTLLLMPSLAISQEETQPQEEQPAQNQNTEKEGGLTIPEQGAGPVIEENIIQPEAKPELDTERIYTIKQGDTLWDISNAFLKDPFLWPLIWKVNTYIKNPDIIYPGNKLTIPSITPVERAMEASRQPMEETIEPLHPEEEISALPQTPAIKPKEVPALPAEEAPAQSKFLLPEEAEAPIIDKYAMLNAGFIDYEETDDVIIGSPEGKGIFSYDDVVYIKIKSRSDVNIGDRFLIYKPLNKVKHPDTGENFGRLIKVLGILKVIAKDKQDILTGRITLSFDASEPGSLLGPYQEPTLVYEKRSKTEKNINRGFILEVVDGRTINAQTDIVYLDKGSADGVEPGDRFSVFVDPGDEKPRKSLGEVQVFLVKERTSTAIVRKSTDTLAKGDIIEYKP